MAGFTEKYGVTRLVWFETHDPIEAAIRGGEAPEEVAARMEGSADRERESGLAGPLS